jgi:hypothetical protein
MLHLSGSRSIYFPIRPHLEINIARYGRDCKFIFPLTGCFARFGGDWLRFVKCEGVQLVMSAGEGFNGRPAIVGRW